MQKASESLAAAFADPAKGADDLAEKYGILDAATLGYIHDLVEQGHQTEAQTVLLKKLEGAFDGARRGTVISSRDRGRESLIGLRTPGTEMGKAIDVALGGGSTMDKPQ